MCQERAASSGGVEPWLNSLGFRFDPFQHLEASADPHLGEYIVGHETFAITWDDTPALIFARAGGGKTAMRIYAARACWVGLGGSHPFPIPYVLPNYVVADHPISLDAHMRGLLQATAAALLIGLAFRPERFLALNTTDRRALTAILQRTLPGPLSHYLDMMREASTPLALSALVDRAYVLPDPPNQRMLLDLCAALDDAASPDSISPDLPKDLFERLVEFILGPLNFRSIFLLVDGVDAFPETMADPAAAAECVTSLLAQATAWTEQRIFLKCFLLIETQAPLAAQLPYVLPKIRQASLVWTPMLLAEVIRRRVYVASGGEFGSLDALAGPALRDVETTLVKSIPPLPREALVLVGRVLSEYTRRDGESGRLEPEDIDAALGWYWAHQV